MADVDKVKAQAFIKKITSPEHLRSWCKVFFGIDFPLGHIYPESNSSPCEAMYEVYSTYVEDKVFEKPGYIWLSARDCYKTLSESALNVLLLAHTGSQIAHLAAIKAQSEKSISYVNLFIRKIEPYLNHHGMTVVSDSKSKAQILLDNGDISYVNTVVCTTAGANCIDPRSIVYKYPGSIPLQASEIKVGDIITTLDYTINKQIGVKVGSISYTNKRALNIEFNDGSNVITSTDHQIFTQRGWITAKQVRVGDKVTGGGEAIRTEPNLWKRRVESVDIDQLILGTLLGDASLCFTSNFIRYSVSHCKSQLEYLEFIRDVFLHNGIKCRIIPSGTRFKLFTVTHPIFNKFADLYIPKKTITKKWLDMLTMEGIAYWIMDDGSGGNSHAKYKDRPFSISTCCFSMPENELVVEWFNKQGFECFIDYTSNSKGVIYPVVSFTLDASRYLSKEISQFFVTCMMYKLMIHYDEQAGRFIDSGEAYGGLSGSYGFRWYNCRYRNTRKGRRYAKLIRSSLTTTVTKIQEIGFQDLIDIHIDTNNEHHKSFLCNSMKLVHNSEHVPFMTFDELDVVQSIAAFNEAQFIPARLRGRGPLTVKCSTRKFPFGLMAESIDRAKETGETVLQWNIIDVTERCSEDRHRPDLPKETRYIDPELPLRQYSASEISTLSDKVRDRLQVIEAHAGCVKCPLLPVCRMALADRPKGDVGGLYKPIDFTIRQFKQKVDPDMIGAQVLCWRPKSTGLVYPRFVDLTDPKEGNVYDIHQAYSILTGQDANGDVSLMDLITKIHELKIRFYVGGDWGFRHATAFVVACEYGREWWLVDCHSVPGLEFEQILNLAMNHVKDIYNPKKWAMDTAYPSYIKTFNSKGMSCYEFKKDVMGGISAVRGQVVDGYNRRSLKIIKHDRTQFLIDGMKQHHFKLDSAGNPTEEPDDEKYADVLDGLRYLAQNRFKPSKGISTGEDRQSEPKGFRANPLTAGIPQFEYLSRQIEQRVTDPGEKKIINGSGTIIVDFGDD